MKRSPLLVGLLALLLPCPVAGDSLVEFDFVTGTGQVSRATVQTAFNLNNGQTKKLAGQVSFSFVESATLHVICGDGTVISPEVVIEEASVVSEISPPPPPNGQFDQFDLEGYTDVRLALPPPPSHFCSGGTDGSMTRIQDTLFMELGGSRVVVLQETR